MATKGRRMSKGMSKRMQQQQQRSKGRGRGRSATKGREEA